MRLRIALAGDTMLGRGVGALLAERGDRPICSPEVAEVARSADLFVLNLECCISERGERWPDPRKPFFFRAPPAAAETLAALGVDAVTLANNHALDYGEVALLDTMRHLDAAGIAHAGAGADQRAARRPAVLERAGARVALVSLSDHPRAFAAGGRRAGIAHADLEHGLPAWVRARVDAHTGGPVLVSPHWGPNMVASPVPHVRRAARALAHAGAAVVAGHSAHVFHGVGRVGDCAVLYDLGDFVDDYAVDRVLRNDLGALWVVTLDEGVAVRVEALPLELSLAYTATARDDGRAWVVERLRAAAHPLEVRDDGALAVIELAA